MKDNFRIAHFYALQAAILFQKHRFVEGLTGGRHRASEGGYCENLLREFIREVLPDRYGVDTGFIKGPSSDPHGCSRQIDVLVHDRLEYSPVFRSGDLVVVLPDAARAAIEVKKTLTSKELAGALDLLASVAAQTKAWKSVGQKRLITGIFAFKSDPGLKPKTARVSRSYVNRYEDACRQFSPSVAVPDFTIVAGEVVLVRSGSQDEPVRVFLSRTEKEQMDLTAQILARWLTLRLRIPEATSKVQRFEWPPGRMDHEVLEFSSRETQKVAEGSLENPPDQTPEGQGSR